MRILWLAHRDLMNPLGGGAERTAFELGTRLVAMGHEFTIAASSFPGGRDQELGGVRIKRFRANVGPHVASFSMMRTMDSDVVVADLAHVVPWPEPVLAHRPIVVCFRHLHARTLSGQVPPSLGIPLRWVETQYRRLYRSAIWVTESVSSQADLASLGIDEVRVRRIAPGVDSKVFSPRPKSSEPSLVYFGGMRAYKRPELVIRLFAELHKSVPDLTLRVVGAGPLLERLVRDVRDLGAGGAGVTILGRRRYEELPDVIGSAWVNVHTSIAEGWCYSATEAASCGTPTVGFRIPGLVESVRDGETGLLADDLDMRGLENRCAILLDHHEEFGRRARETAQLRDWNHVAAAWESVLREAAR